MYYYQLYLYAYKYMVYQMCIHKYKALHIRIFRNSINCYCHSNSPVIVSFSLLYYFCYINIYINIYRFILIYLYRFGYIRIHIYIIGRPISYIYILILNLILILDFLRFHYPRASRVYNRFLYQ